VSEIGQALNRTMIDDADDDDTN